MGGPAALICVSIVIDYANQIQFNRLNVIEEQFISFVAVLALAVMLLLSVLDCHVFCLPFQRLMRLQAGCFV